VDPRLVLGCLNRSARLGPACEDLLSVLSPQPPIFQACKRARRRRHHLPLCTASGVLRASIGRRPASSAALPEVTPTRASGRARRRRPASESCRRRAGVRRQACTARLMAASAQCPVCREEVGRVLLRGVHVARCRGAASEGSQPAALRLPDGRPCPARARMRPPTPRPPRSASAPDNGRMVA